jgi:enamine deaminase RidA (YjgF/YER057c/UK114 family)
VVKLNIYLLDRSNLPLLREVRDQYVNTQSPPASTLVVAHGLAREEFLLEIEAIASLPA